MTQPKNKTKVYVKNPFLRFFLLDMVKWSLSDQEFIGKNPEAPKIDSHIVLSSLKDFRCRIVKSSTIGFSSFIANSWPSKVTQFTGSVWHDDIFRLNVSMGNTILMHVNDSFRDFLYFMCCIVVLKLFVLF